MAATYPDARSRVEQLLSRDGPEVRADCGTFFLDHGRPTGKSIVFFHGLTNCPRQFRRLAEEFHDRGCNVLSPRFPYHGLEDRMTEEVGLLTADELKAIGDESVDIAQGLGERVLVVGLSIGGTLTAWCAQRRADVAEATMICPLFGVRVIPRWATDTLARAARNLPNFHMWWDPVKREKLEAPDHVYPRFASRAVAEVLILGQQVKSEAARAPFAAGKLRSITVANDISVSNRATQEIIALWDSHGPKKVETFEFSASAARAHDFIDPDQPRANTELVYPKLIEIILGD